MNLHDDIEKFLGMFVRHDARRRYQSIFSLKESSWKRITFHQFECIRIESATHTYVTSIRPSLPHPSHSPAICIWDHPIIESLRPFADSKVDVFATGHTGITGHKKEILEEVLTDYSIIRDGFVTIVRNSLYVLFDHDDNITIARNQT